jgi:hypothetical protein
MTSSASAAIIDQVATATRPATSAVVAALLDLEKSGKNTPIPFEHLAGTWQLRFASGAKKTKQGLKLGKGYYLPSWVYAAISFDPTGKIMNQLRLGALEIRFTGPCRLHDKKNIVVFDFLQLQILLGNQVLLNRYVGKYPIDEFGERPIAKLPFFVFLAASTEAIAARGRGGGLAIWVKADQK